MGKIFTYCLIVFCLAGCLNEQRVDPAKPSTFVRYINGGYADEPRALEKTTDGGYVILANTLGFPNYTSDSSTFLMDRVKLVKVDQYGSVLWTRILPDGRGAGVIGFHGNGIHVFDQGYIISGEVIKNDGTTDLLIIQTDAEGIQQGSHLDLLMDTDNNGTVESGVRGLASTRISETRLMVLAGITGGTNDMMLAELDIRSSTDPVSWSWAYGSSSATLINKLFLQGSPTTGELVFGGTIVDPGNANSTQVRFVAAQQNSSAPPENRLGDPDLSESANNMCKSLNGYAMIGSSNVAAKQDRDILFTRVGASGVQLAMKTFPVYYPGTQTDVGLDDEGNAICETSDHGFIILGTVQSSTIETADNQLSIGRGESDYYLMRIDAFGALKWAKAFGSKREDVGVAVLQAEDGGFLMLGKTVLANVPTIALIKTNGDGEME